MAKSTENEVKRLCRIHPCNPCDCMVTYCTMEEVSPYFFASDTVWKLSISGIRAREEPFSHRI